VKGIPLPERTEDFSADPVELFFDLAYVLAFSVDYPGITRR
jgi:hypothetical protein